jgi:hypothetical protein
MKNKELWESVKVTDPRHVKPITGKTYKGDSPKPYWLIERATEAFGPIGIGWGVNVKSEGFIHIGEHDVLHQAVVSIWFMKDGVRSEPFEQMGGTKAAYMSSKGVLIVDEDAGKKSVTDGMVKCLSMIGFAGDIFSGQWGDSKYVEWAADYHANRRDPEEEAERQAWLDDKKGAIFSAATVGDLKSVLAEAVEFAMDQNDSAAVDQLNAWAEEKKAQAKPKKVA